MTAELDRYLRTHPGALPRLAILPTLPTVRSLTVGELRKLYPGAGCSCRGFAIHGILDGIWNAQR